MKKKTILVAAIAVMLVAALVVGGTLAYFTDTKSADNTFTMGNVKIALNEQQRTDNTKAYDETTNKLVNFEDGKVLLPLAGSAQGAEHDSLGLPVGLENYHDKLITVTNTGKNDAYVRVYMAVPATLEAKTAEAGDFTDSIFHVNYNSKDTTWDAEHRVGTVTLDNVVYNVYYRTCNQVVATGTTTTAAYIGCYLDNRVDASANGYTFNGQAINFDFSNGVKIPVMAVAVQADGFTSADAAFGAAFAADYIPFK